MPAAKKTPPTPATLPELDAGLIASLVSADDAGGLRPSLWLSGVRLLVRAEDARQAQEILGSSK